VDQLVHQFVPLAADILRILSHYQRHSVVLPHRYDRIECGVVNVVTRIAGETRARAVVLPLCGVYIKIRDYGPIVE
jgi:hypothetical protein